MTNPEIPDRARGAALAALQDDDMWHRPDSGGVWRASYERAVELVLTAALPHLRVQETPPVKCHRCGFALQPEDTYTRLDGTTYHLRSCPSTIDEALATPHPRPVVDLNVGDAEHPTARKHCDDSAVHVQHNHYDSEERAWYQCAGTPSMRPVVDREALRGRLDQLWGWAKSGRTKDADGGEYYLMDVENVDQFTEDVLALLTTEEAAGS
jgi:hypothetical protein